MYEHDPARNFLISMNYLLIEQLKRVARELFKKAAGYLLISCNLYLKVRKFTIIMVSLEVKLDSRISVFRNEKHF